MQMCVDYSCDMVPSLLPSNGIIKMGSIQCRRLESEKLKFKLKLKTVFGGWDMNFNLQIAASMLDLFCCVCKDPIAK